MVLTFITEAGEVLGLVAHAAPTAPVRATLHAAIKAVSSGQPERGRVGSYLQSAPVHPLSQAHSPLP